MSEAAGEAPGLRQPPACGDSLPAGSDLQLKPPVQRGCRGAEELHLCHKEQAGYAQETWSHVLSHISVPLISLVFTVATGA